MERSVKKTNIVADRRGSALLIVVIAMLFVIILGVALLFTSYSAYTVKIAQRGDKSNFYTASAALDDIRSGLEQKVGDAVKAAYTDTLVKNLPSADAKKAFETSFYDELKTVRLGSDSNPPALLAPDSDKKKTDVGTYSTAALQTFISDTASGAKYTVNGGDVSGKYVIAENPSALTLQGVRVKCVNAKGYASEVSADITVALPDFMVGSRAVTAIGTTVIVASKGLVGSGAVASVTGGDVYVGKAGYGAGSTGENAILGSVTVSKGGSLTFDGCTLTCTGDVENNGILKFKPGADDPSTPLWAQNIILGAGSKTELGGRVNVKNDLQLTGSGADVKLTGSYYGFGSGNTADESSAIIVNGQHCTMDVSGLETLSLAGVSFINATKNLKTSSTGSSIRTGQSVAAKPDQLAYLIPANCITNYTTNPCVEKKDTNGNVIAPAIVKTKPLWGTTKTLSNYNNWTQQNVYTSSGLIYVFLKFSDQTSANAYYADYYKYGSFNGVSVPDYLRQYLTLTGSARTAYATAGSAYKMGEGGVSLVPASMAASAGSGWSSIISGDPFEQYADRAGIKKDFGTAAVIFSLKDANGNSIQGPKAVIVNNAGTDPYHFDSKSDQAICLIVATGDVVVEAPFAGTIICDGKVTITTGSVTSQRFDSIYDATEDGAAKGTTPKVLSAYVKGFSGRQAEADAWSLDRLVYYENWKKY